MVVSLAQFETLAGKRSKGSLSATDEDLTVELLRSFPKGVAVDDRSDWAAAAADVITTTTSNRVRNAAASALADLGAGECSGRIVEVLRRPAIAKASGTLLYALRELGASIPLSVFIGLMENGSFEGRAEALAFLDENKVELLNDADVEGSLTKLGVLATEKGDPDGFEAAKFALDLLRYKQQS